MGAEGGVSTESCLEGTRPRGLSLFAGESGMPEGVTSYVVDEVGPMKYAGQT